MYYILERGGEKNMKKRWFVVILTIGLLLHVLPLSVLALSPDPTITDADGTILDWSDLSTVSDVLDDSQKQNSAVVDAKSGTDAETGSGKSLADADNDEEAADNRPTVNLTPKTPDEESGGDDPADADRDKAATDDLPAGNPTPKTLDKGPGDDDLADADRDEAAADDLSAANPTPQPLDEETDDDDPADDADSTTAPAVCKIDKIDDTYYYSTLDDAITAATDDDQIDLLTNIEMDTGLTFTGKTLTISGSGTYTLTLKGYGIYAYESNLTFQDLTLNLYAKEHTYEHSAGATANLISNSDLHLKRVTCTISPEGNCGSGMYLYQQTNLYLDDSEVTVDAANGSMVDGIMADPSEYDNKPNREVILNNSRLIATGCSHAGLMLDPIDMTLENSSEVEVANNGEYGFSLYDGELTMKNSTLKATDNDTGGPYPGWHFGIYVGSLNMDAASTLEAYSNGGSGLGIGSPNGSKKSYIRGHVICEGNGVRDPGCGGALCVYAEHDEYVYEGDVTIEDGATVSLCNNVGLSGLLNSWKLTIASNATVIVDNNAQLGFANSFDARTTIKSGANVSANNNLYGIYNYAGGGDLSVATGFFLIEGGAHVTANKNRSCGIFNTVYDNFDTPADDYFTIQSGAVISADGNGGHGIYNDGGIFTVEPGAIVSACNNGYYGIFNNKGTFTVENGVDLQVEYNKESGVVNVENSKLTLFSGCVRYNTTNDLYGYGGGLRNYGEATLSDDVQLYNNHAKKGGDDIENGKYATITFGPTGRGWELDGYPDCYDFITGWYDDSETTRWNAHEGGEADLHMDLVAPVASYTGPLSLKAAHGSTGSLTVCKETVGELLPSDYDTVFTFELTLDDDAITTINDKWCGVPFKNGKASFTLKSGESITLSNLPAGIGYTITETAQDGWTLLNLNPAETGVVPQNDTAKVVFTNLKNSPDDPYVPVVPVDPEEPEIPEEPEGPETSEEPEEPEIPEETEETEETEAPGELPAEEPAQTDTSASLAQPEETPTQNTTTVTLIQTGTTDWLAAVLLIFGIGLSVCGWFFDRKQRAAKH